MSSFAPEAPAPAPVPPMPDKPAFVVKGWHWVVSILIPFIGIVLGIIAIAKNQIGKGIGLIAVSFTSWLLCFIVFAALAASGTATALESANAGSLAPAADVAPAVEEPVEAPAPVEDS